MGLLIDDLFSSVHEWYFISTISLDNDWLSIYKNGFQLDWIIVNLEFGIYFLGKKLEMKIMFVYILWGDKVYDQIMFLKSNGKIYFDTKKFF